MGKILDIIDGISWLAVVKRLLVLIVPTVLIPFGISGYFASNLGSDPFSVFIDGVHAVTGLTHGRVTLINSITLVTLMSIFGRKHLGVGTIVLALTAGPLIDVFLSALLSVIHTDYGALLASRIIVLLAGCVALSVGIGVFIILAFGIGGIEWLVLTISEKLKISLRTARIVFDASLLCVGWLLGGLVGVGTILGAAATGPIIALTIRLLDKKVQRFIGALKA